jgi:hypothetical protein
MHFIKFLDVNTPQREVQLALKLSELQVVQEHMGLSMVDRPHQSFY